MSREQAEDKADAAIAAGKWRPWVWFLLVGGAAVAAIIATR
jgi:hypothetical protein